LKNILNGSAQRPWDVRLCRRCRESQRCRPHCLDGFEHGLAACKNCRKFSPARGKDISSGRAHYDKVAASLHHNEMHGWPPLQRVSKRRRLWRRSLQGSNSISWLFRRDVHRHHGGADTENAVIKLQRRRECWDHHGHLCHPCLCLVASRRLATRFYGADKLRVGETEYVKDNGGRIGVVSCRNIEILCEIEAHGKTKTP